MDNKTNWKIYAEHGFGHLADSIGRHPWRWLLSLLLLIGLLASNLPKIKADNSLESFLANDSPVLLAYDSFRRLFGRDDTFIVTVEVQDLFDPRFIANFRSFHEELEENTPYLDTVTSLINARITYGTEEGLIIEELLEKELPNRNTEAGKEKLAFLKNYTYNNPQYQSYLIAEDRHLISLQVKLIPYIVKEADDGTLSHINLQEEQFGESAAVIESIIEKYRGRLSNDIRMSGAPSIGVAVGSAMKRDFAVFTGLSLAVISLVLAVVFRRASGVIMPLIIMSLGITLVMSLMATLGTPMQITTSLLPSFLLAVCVGYSIHLLSIFYQQYDKGDTKQEAIRHAMQHSGLAILFTSITTAAGLASFTTSKLVPVANLGFYGATGAFLAFVLTACVLPCLITLIPIRRKMIMAEKKNILSHFTATCVSLSTTHPFAVTASSLAIFALSIFLALQLTFAHDPLSWFPKDHPIPQAVEITETRMGGSMPIELVIDTKTNGGALDPKLLKQLEKSLDEIRQWQDGPIYIAKTLSLIDIIKETHKGLNANDQAYYVIPDDAALIRQELFLVEMDAADDLFLLTDRDYSKLRCSILIPSLDAMDYMRLVTRLENHFSTNYTYAYDITGMARILSQTFTEMIYSTADSYMLAACIITIMMIILLGGLRIGLLSMLPNLLPIAMVLGLMKLIGAPLDMFTLLIGSIAIGLTVDDTVHFMHGFKREFSKHGDAAKAIDVTLHSTGLAMLVTTIVLSLGFLIYTQSILNNLEYFGVLTALCISLALLSDFLFAPALMVLASRNPKLIPIK